MNEHDNPQLSQLDQDLLALSRQLIPVEHRHLIRAFICGAVAQSAQQPASLPPSVVQTQAAQLPRVHKRQLTPM